MKKVLNRAARFALPALILGGAVPVLASEMPSREEMWNILQRQQREIQALKGRLGETGAAEAPAPETAADPGGSGLALKWSDRITFSGVVEVEAGHAEEFDGTEGSDATLATVELAMDVVINDWVNVNVVFLHEEDDTELVDVDSGTITIGNLERHPLYLTAGLMGVPFGNFTSNLISDPLTLELGETFESAIQLGFENQGLYGSVYVFNGDANEVNSDSDLEQFGANLGFKHESEAFNLDIGGTYINSIEDSDGISDALGTTTSATVTTAVDTMPNHIGGVSGYGVLGVGPVMLAGEYLTATEDFDVSKMAWNTTQGARPRAWNAELGYTLDVNGKEVIFSTAWQGTREALALGLPESRFLVGASVGILENTGLALEWMQSDDYEVAEGGTGRDVDATTLQLAVEF